MLSDLDALQQLAVALRHVDIPAELRAWLGQQQRRLQMAQPRRLAYAGRHGAFIAGPVATAQPWSCRSAGAGALAQAALNPGQWITLRRGRTRRAWHSAIAGALDSLARVDSDLAQALAFGEYHGGPGAHLRERAGRVEMMWRPAHGMVLDVSSP